MSDSRRSRRPGGHQRWDDADPRRDHGGRHAAAPPRDRGRDPRDRRAYRSRSRERERRGSADRSKSPVDARRQRDGDGDGGRRGAYRAREQRHRLDDRDRRDDRDRHDDGHRRRNNGDRHKNPDPRHRCRSASPRNAISPPPSARPRDAKDATIGASPSNNPQHRSPSPRPKHQTSHRQFPSHTGMEQSYRVPPNEALTKQLDDDDVEVDQGLDAMQAMMGFGGFGSTKGKKIAGNDVGAVRKEKKTEYRQYMNRQGGFNRPLSPSR